MNSQINAAGEQLEDAFQLFNQFSEKLADSYGDLESQIVRLTKELAEARSERLIQLAEKEVLAKRLSGLLDANSNMENIMVAANNDVLLSAIQNVINNAIEACAEVREAGPEIEIRAFLNNKDQLEINIKDNGCGMPEAIKERVLEPLFTTRSNGTGLGLAVVNATVSRYGGNINIVSKQDVGSEINITLPRVEVETMLPSNMISADVKMKKMNLCSALEQ